MEDSIKKQLQSRLEKAKEGIQSLDPVSVGAGATSGYFMGKAAQKAGKVKEKRIMRDAIQSMANEAGELDVLLGPPPVDVDYNTYQHRKMRQLITEKAQRLRDLERQMSQRGYLPTEEGYRKALREGIEIESEVGQRRVEMDGSPALERYNRAGDRAAITADELRDIRLRSRSARNKLGYLKKAPIIGAGIGAAISAATGHPEEIFDPAAYTPLGPAEPLGDESPERRAIEEPGSEEFVKERMRRALMKKRLERLR